jgi:O-antigen ligase
LIQKLKQYFNLSNLPVLALCCVVLQFPFYRRYIPITIGLWILLSIIKAIYKKEKFKLNWRLMALVVFFLLHVVGVLWSVNQDRAGFDLEVKMSLAIVPLVFMFSNYKVQEIKMILYTFLFTLMLAIIWLLIVGANNYYCTCETKQLLYIHLSKEIHPSYLAYYMNVGIGIVLTDYFTSALQLFKKRWVYITLVIFFLGFSILLLSKIGVLTSAVLFLFLMIYWFVKGRWKLFIAFSVLSIIGPFVIYKSSKLVQLRVEEFVEGMDDENEKTWLESTSLRTVIWEESTTLFLENFWIGVGTGDVQDELLERYEKAGIGQAYDMNLNAHNQILQSSVALGVLGLVAIIFILLQAFVRMKEMKYFNLVFTLISVMFFFTESVLETQAGVVFFAVFFSVFNSIDFTNNEDETSDTIPVLSA